MTLLQRILQTSKRIPDKRNEYVVLAHTMEEVGELAEEVTISCGTSYKESGPDGVIGEAIDGIICLVDMIYVHAQKNGIEITEEELIEIANKKLNKWEEKCKQYTNSVVEPSPVTIPNLGQTLLRKMKQLFSTEKKSS